MTAPDAAIILHLYREAQPFQDRFERHVFWNEEKKTKHAIVSYIRKSKNVSSEEDLLNLHERPTNLPEHITYQDIPKTMSNPPPTPPHENTFNGTFVHGPAFNATSLTLNEFHPSPQPSSAGSDSSFVDVLGSDDADAFGEDDDAFMGDSFDHARSSNFAPSAPEMAQASSAVQNNYAGIGGADLEHPAGETELDAGAEFQDLMGPFQQQASASVEAPQQNHSLNSMLSYTPPVHGWQTSRSPAIATEELTREITERLGTRQELKNPEASVLNTNFLRHCLEACVYQGQEKRPQREAAIQRAVAAFHDIVTGMQSDCSLTALSNMLFLLDLYGQKGLAQLILSRVDQVGLERCPGNIISETIRFKRTIPKPGQDPIYDLPSLHRVVESAQAGARAAGLQDSHLVLSAQYNLAWALLEMKQFDEALALLIDIRPSCERVFGLHQVQTIMCVATLARAYLQKDKSNAIAAEALIDEVVAPRVKKAFSKNHPFYWESENRQALFKLRLAQWNIHPESTEQYWNEGEKMMRRVLLWRIDELGLNNPQTTRTLNVLKHWLGERGKEAEADQLVLMLESQLQNQLE